MIHINLSILRFVGFFLEKKEKASRAGRLFWMQNYSARSTEITFSPSLLFIRPKAKEQTSS
jgi:hypothetical protein